MSKMLGVGENCQNAGSLAMVCLEFSYGYRLIYELWLAQNNIEYLMQKLSHCLLPAMMSPT